MADNGKHNEIDDFMDKHIRLSSSIIEQAFRVETFISMQIDDVLEIDEDFGEALFLPRNGESIWTELFFSNPGVMIQTMSGLQKRFPNFNFEFQSFDSDEVLVIRKLD